MDAEKKSLMNKITDKRIQLENYLDQNLQKINPTGIEAKRNNLLIASSVTTLLVGLYTYVMPKNLLYTILRSGVHFSGAFAFPAAGALASSLAMHGIEGIANLGINGYNKKHPENPKEPFKINPKVKNAIQLLSSAAVGIAYAYGTLNYESDQILKTGNIQYEQYAADILGSLGGIAAFHKLDIKDTFGSCANLLWKSGNAFAKAVNGLEDKFLGKSKEKDDTTQKTQNLILENLEVDSNLKKSNQDKSHVWDLDLYKDSKVPNEHQKSNTPSSVSRPENIQTNELTEEDDKINI